MCVVCMVCEVRVAYMMSVGCMVHAVCGACGVRECARNMCGVKYVCLICVVYNLCCRYTVGFVLYAWCVMCMLCALLCCASCLNDARCA